MPAELFTETFPAEPASVPQARRHVAAVLQDHGGQEWVDDARLAVSEIATNVVLHAHTHFDVTVCIETRRARIGVRDYSGTLPASRAHSPDATTGRGLALVSRITAQFGVQAFADGKLVWFVLGEPAAGQTLAAWGADDPPPVPEVAVRAVLLDVPAALWSAALEHHAAVLRELFLLQSGLVRRPGRSDVRDLDLAAAGRARQVLVAATDRALREAPGASRVDVEVPDGDVDGAAFEGYQDALDVGRRLSQEGALLVPPALPEVVSLRDWVCHQVVAQGRGVAPTRWQEPAVESEPQAGRDVGAWDDAVMHTEQAVVAADGANRIIAVTDAAARLLRGTAADLVGRRITTIVPPRLREQHVVGFSRHLATGRVTVLGTPIDLPVLLLDGTEEVHRFLIEQRPAAGGRHVYLAWIDP